MSALIILSNENKKNIENCAPVIIAIPSLEREFSKNGAFFWNFARSALIG
jgi:hypothetical protein